MNTADNATRSQQTTLTLSPLSSGVDLRVRDAIAAGFSVLEPTSRG